MTFRSYLVGLVGSGVGPSLTPALHEAEARHLGLAYTYRTIDIADRGIAPEQIGEVLQWARDLGFDALNVTHPCKQLVLPHLDRIDPVAEALGAVNTVIFTPDGAVGHNTDTSGFATAFTAGLPDAARREVVLIGAGGAGAAVADAVLRLGAERLTVVDVDDDRAARLARELADRHDTPVTGSTPDKLPALLADADGVVHCTPTGMADHPGLPFDAALLRPDLWVADIVYRPLETALVLAARAAGSPTLDGGAMAVHQAVDALRLITGVAPDAARMTQHFHRLVDAVG
ncbi:shikimate dehydrogenase [Aeromicrobium sp. Leaf350]|uniref:shikimate dehydrogenase n=1 Tax=Aeromicrobium sp. Leaf350 TaxID=2876565 RepID=UPI001E45E03D|nr:shikimate dehydrogenase [Aeromicrobium sp. Leaf350]